MNTPSSRRKKKKDFFDKKSNAVEKNKNTYISRLCIHFKQKNRNPYHLRRNSPTYIVHYKYQ